MRTASRRKLEAARRALRFCLAHPDPNPAAAQSVARLDQLLASAAARGTAQYQSQREALDARAQRNRLHHALRTRLPALLHLTALVAGREGNGELAIRLARDTRSAGASFMAEVRRALVQARKEQELLARYGLPDTLLDELEADLLRYELAERMRTEREAAGAAASTALDELAEEAHQVVRHLDALYRLRFADDPGALDAWRADSTVDWGRREAVGDDARTSLAS